MPEKLLTQSREVFVSTTATSLAASRALKAGKLRKLGSRLYTSNLNDEPAAIIRRNLWPIVGGYFPRGAHSGSHGVGEFACRGRVCLPRNHTGGGHRAARSAPAPA